MARAPSMVRRLWLAFRSVCVVRVARRSWMAAGIGCCIAGGAGAQIASPLSRELPLDRDLTNNSSAIVAEPAGGRGFRSRTPEQSGVTFTHHSGAVGSDKRFMVECVGSGVGLFDVDDDGNLDLYMVQGADVNSQGEVQTGSASRDELYLNDGGGRFHNVSQTAGDLSEGFGFGVTAGDVDDDGDEDIFVTNLGHNVLLENLLETSRFAGEEASVQLRRVPDGGGLAGDENDWSTGAAFGDIDGDGDLDAYVANYLAHDLSHRMLSGQPCRWLGCEVPCGPKGLSAQGDRLFLNDGSGNFSEITQETAVGKARPAYGFQPVFSDLDDDGDLDLFVSNDSMPNNFYLNKGVGDDGLPMLAEQAMRSGLALSDSGKEQAGMGVAVGDVDGDGLFDMVMTNFSREPNALFRNASAKKYGALFFDEAGRFGIGRPSYFDLGWGVSLFDAELDGDTDLFIANGHVYPQVEGCDISQVRFGQPDKLFTWEDDRFAPMAVDDSAARSFSEERASRGLAAGDTDNDGDIDLIVGVLDGAPTVLENIYEHEGRWLKVDLRPMSRSVGARVEVNAGERRWVKEVRRGSSFLGVESRVVHFGLPRSSRSLKVTVRWLDGSEDRWEEQAPDQKLVLAHGSGR